MEICKRDSGEPFVVLHAKGEALARERGVTGLFVSLSHARIEIERWRREYNEERPKKSLGGLPPAVYATQLARQASSIPGRL